MPSSTDKKVQTILDFSQDDPCDRDVRTAIKSVCKVQLPILKYIEIEELFLSDNLYIRVLPVKSKRRLFLF